MEDEVEVELVAQRGGPSRAKPDREPQDPQEDSNNHSHSHSHGHGHGRARKESEAQSESDGLDGSSVVFRSYVQRPRYCGGCSVYRILATPMIFVVFGLIAVSYIPHTFVTKHTNVGDFIDLVGFNVLVALLVVSYLQCMLTDPGTVPPAWQDAVDKANEHTQSLFKKCRKSGKPKPPRSHYDSVTQRLVLNMDHFCPWVVNTVGFYNRKFFVLFLLYTLLSCAWFVTSTFVRVAWCHESLFGAESGFGILRLVAFVVDLTLGLTLSCFLYFHVHLVVTNQTTIDEGDVPEYNVGWRRNTEQVFGSNPWTWLLPVYGSGPVGDGVNWPTNIAEGNDKNRLLRGVIV